MYIHISAILIN